MNVICLLCDSLNRHFLNAYGQKIADTPNIDWLRPDGLPLQGLDWHHARALTMLLVVTDNDAPPSGTDRAVAVLMNPTADLLGSILAFGLTINLALAFFNLIPIPPLDGSRMVMAVVQRLSGDRISAATERLVYFAGWVAMMLFIVIVTISDIQGLFE